MTRYSSGIGTSSAAGTAWLSVSSAGAMESAGTGVLAGEVEGVAVCSMRPILVSLRVNPLRPFT